MPRNGSGTYGLPQTAFVAGTTISSAAMNSDLSDIATALTGSLPRDGQAGMTGQLKLPDGSAVAPAFTFNNESNTGFIRSGVGSIGVIINGVQIFAITSTGIPGTVPVGIFGDWAGPTLPALWLFCFGQAVSRTTYAALFAAIGVTYGSGDGSTTFNVPDGRGYAFVGKDDMGGAASGRLTTAFYGSSPIVLGNPGGLQSRSLITANLPPITPTGTIGITDPGHTHTYNTLNAGVHQDGTQAADVFTVQTLQTTNSAVTGISASFTGTGGGGSSTAFSFVQPSFIVNKIIYAGV